MGKVCVSCGGELPDPQMPEEEDEKCEDCADAEMMEEEEAWDMPDDEESDED